MNILKKIMIFFLIGTIIVGVSNTASVDAKAISEQKAVEVVRKKLGNSFSYFYFGDKIAKNGKEYYVIYVKTRIDGHYSTQTQYMVSTDGKVVAEGEYIQGSGKIQFYDKKLNNKIYWKLYTAKKLGIKDLFREWSDKEYSKYSIISLKNKTVTVRKCKFNEGVSFGRKKTFKLANNCRYYVGSSKIFWNKKEKYNNELDVPFIRKVSKKEFKTKIGKMQCYDQMIIKKGKVIKLFTNMQLAD